MIVSLAQIFVTFDISTAYIPNLFIHTVEREISFTLFRQKMSTIFNSLNAARNFAFSSESMANKYGSNSIQIRCWNFHIKTIQISIDELNFKSVSSNNFRNNRADECWNKNLLRTNMRQRTLLQNEVESGPNVVEIVMHYRL